MATPREVALKITARDQTLRAFRQVDQRLVRLRKSVRLVNVMLAGLASAKIISSITGGLQRVGRSILGIAAAGLQSVDRIGKLSKSLGVTTEDLAALRIAADLGGSSLDSFARGAALLSKNAFDFVTRGAGEAKDAFEALGLGQDKLRPLMQDQIALLGKVADGLNALPAGPKKTALAYRLLGRSASELLAALEGGSAALRAAKSEAVQLGLALSGDAVRGVERANDAITRIKFLFEGFRDQTLAQLAPIIESLAGQFKDWILEIQRAEGGIGKFSQRSAVHILNFLRSVTLGIAKIGRFVQEVLGDLPGFDNTEAATRDLLKAQSHVNALKQTLGDLRAMKGSILPSEFKSSILETTTALNKAGIQVLTFETRLKRLQGGFKFDEGGVNNFFDGLERRITSFKSSGTSGAGGGGRGRSGGLIGNALGLGEVQTAVDDFGSRLGQLLPPLDAVAAKHTKLLLLREELELMRDAISPSLYVQYAASLDAAGRALAKMEEPAKKVGQALDDSFGEEMLAEMERINRLAGDIGGAFSSAFERAIFSGQKLSDVLRGLAEDISRVFLRQTVTEPAGNFLAKLVKSFLPSSLSLGGSSGSIDSIVSSGAPIDGLAAGGAALARKTYLIGERGPELLRMGSQGGNVTPNHALGGSTKVTVVIDNRGAPKEVQSVTPRFDPTGMVVRIIQNDVRIGGPISSAFGGRQ